MLITAAYYLLLQCSRVELQGALCHHEKAHPNAPGVPCILANSNKKNTLELALLSFTPNINNGGEVKQQTPGSSITRRGNNCISVLVKVVTLKWLWRPLPAGLARAQLHGGQFQVVPSASATLDRPSFEFYASAALRVRRYHQSDFESGRFSPGSLSPSSCPRSWCHVVSTNAFHAVVRGWHVRPGDQNQTSAGLRL